MDQNGNHDAHSLGGSADRGHGKPVPYGCRPPGGAAGPAPLGPLSRPVDRATAHAYQDPEQIGRLSRGEEVAPFYPRLSQQNAIGAEARIAALADCDGAVVFASGMAAISAVFLGVCGHGDGVLVAQEVYGGTDALVEQDLPRFGIQVERFLAAESGALEAALERFQPRLVWVETPINPLLRVVDLTRAAAACHRAGAILACDSTLAPPTLQDARRHGADLVVHSATKYLAGHSDLLAGVVAGPHRHLEAIAAWRTRTGGVLGPDGAWLLERSLATLELRAKAQERSAAHLWRSLQPHQGQGALLRVVHPADPEHPDRDAVARQMPGGGALVGIEVAGGLDGAREVARRLQVIARAPSLGGVESVVSIPADTTHAGWTPSRRRAAGIPEGWLRISVGLEAVDALLADLCGALEVGQPAAGG